MRIYLDSNVWIAAEAADDELDRALAAMFEASRRGLIVLVTSELTLAELLVKPIREGKTQLASTYQLLISTRLGLQVMAIERVILQLAAEIRAMSSATKLPDAIHLATAEHTQSTVIMSGDERLRPRDPLRQVRPTTSAIAELLAQS